MIVLFEGTRENDGHTSKVSFSQSVPSDSSEVNVTTHDPPTMDPPPVLVNGYSMSTMFQFLFISVIYLLVYKNWNLKYQFYYIFTRTLHMSYSFVPILYRINRTGFFKSNIFWLWEGVNML